MSQVEVSALAQIWAGGGEMGVLMRTVDWSKTPLGPIEAWPQSLKTTTRLMLNSRYPMFVWWGHDLTNLYNEAYIPVLGKRHPAALGQSAPQIWAEIWDVVGPQAETVLNEGRATWNEALLLVMERYGYVEETYFTFSYSPLPNDDGSIGGVFCACTEDTRRVIGERRLRTLRDLGAQASEGKTAEQTAQIVAETLARNPMDVPFALIYLLDVEGQWARLAGSAGVEAGAPAAPPLLKLTGPEADASLWPLGQVAETGQTVVVADLPARFSSLPAGPWPEPPHTAVVWPIVAQGQGTTTSFLVIGVSSRRMLDDDYQGFFELVAGHIATAVANARAYEAERQRAEALAELDRAKTIFFSNISHEFRTPLTLLLGPLEDTLAGVLGPLLPEQQEGLDLAYRNSLRLLKLVNTLLDFSRIEMGRVQASFQPTDLAAFTAELVSVFRSAVERAGLQLVVDCPPLPEPVYIDREMWEKIVLNLLSNAFKFTDEGQITVTLRAHLAYVALAVADTGIGIPADELPHIFDRFYRVHHDHARTYEGTGIGLSLVQELIGLHEGQVEVTSEFGQGTVFTVRLPRGTAHLPADRIETQPAPVQTSLETKPYVEESLRWLSEQGEQATVETMRMLPTELLAAASSASPGTLHGPGACILLVEDNADIRDYLCRLLSTQWMVEAVPNGAAALTVAQERRPDLVLADVMMPGLDGFALLRELRADPRTQAIPIILLSARAGEEAIVAGLEAGADDYLIKPFSARELLARVGAHLELARTRRQTAQRERELYAETAAVQERLEQILAGIRDHFVMYDHEWRYVYVNAGAAQMLGLPKEQLIGQCIWDLFPEAVGNLFYQKVHQAVAEGQEIVFEHYYQPWDFWVENRAYPISEGLLLFATDITARKRWEVERDQLLQQVEGEYERLETILARMPAGIIIAAAPSGQSLLVNEQAKRLTGYTFETSVELERYTEIQSFQGLFPDGRVYESEEWPLARAVRKGEVVFNEEIELLRADGSRVNIQANATPIYNSAGDIIAGVTTFVDITAQKRVEQALRESEERFRVAQELSLDAFTILKAVRNPAGQIVDFTWEYVNPAAERMLLRSKEELVGRRLLEILPGHKTEGDLFERYVRVAETGQPHDLELSYLADGITGWFRNMTVKLGDGIIVSFNDISARKREEVARQLLAEAGKILGSSLHPTLQLSQVAQLAVPNLADWGVVALYDEDWVVDHVAVVHSDPAKVELVRELQQRYPPRREELLAQARPWLRGQPELYPEITEAVLKASARDDEHFRLLRDLNLHSAIIAPLVARRRVFGLIALCWAESDKRYDQQDLALAEELARRIAVALDNARLYEAEQQARQAAEETTERIASLQVVTTKLSKALTPTQVAQVIFDHGLPAVEASSGTVALLTENGAEFEIIGSSGYSAEGITAWRRFPNRLGWPMPDVVSSGQPLFIASRQETAVLYENLSSALNTPPEAWAVIPLIGERGAIGALNINFTNIQEFSAKDREFILTLAQQCAQALDRARLYEVEQRARAEAEANQQRLALLAEMRERNRLAQELHDTVAQSLGYVNLKLSLVNTMLVDDQLELIKANLQELKNVVGEVYTDVREEIFNLRAKVLSGLGFRELLDRYIDKYGRFYNMDIQLLQEADPALFEFPAEVAPQIIRTIQEALINIRKHAQVNTAIIRLSQENGQIRIVIEDQGQGFDLAKIKRKTSSFGLQIMRERVESVGGSLEIDTAPGRGTKVILRYRRD